MIKTIKLNDELVKKISQRTVKAIDLVKFLVSIDGINYNKEMELENVSINMLVADSHKVEGASIDTYENEIILTLSDIVEPDAESTKKLITMEKVVINENEIYIGSESTCFCQAVSKKVIDIKSLIRKYNELIKLCKSKNIKLSYKNHFKRTLTELTTNYLEEVTEYNDLFNTLAGMWKDKLDRGVCCGYRDDSEVNMLSEIDCKIQRMNVRSSASFKIQSIYDTINNLFENIECGYEDYYQVCL